MSKAIQLFDLMEDDIQSRKFKSEYEAVMIGYARLNAALLLEILEATTAPVSNDKD